MEESTAKEITNDERSNFTPTPLSEWKECVATARRQVEAASQSDDDAHDEIKEWIDSNVPVHYDKAVQSLAYYLTQNQPSKEHVLTVRTILRLLLVTLGVPQPYRAGVQIKFCQSSLLDLLGYMVVKFKQDVKSRVQACRILTNLVTNNETTSRIVLAYWEWQPIEWRDRVATEVDTSHDTATTISTLYWLDFLLATTSMDRSALAALIVCWYNALQAAHASAGEKQKLVHSSLVISNLLRHLLPSCAVLSSQKKDENENSDQQHDEATEWITLLLGFLCQTGSLAHLYTAATGQESSNAKYATRDNPALKFVVPEQVILLQLLLSQMEQSKADAAIILLGDTQARLQQNVTFLAKQLYFAIRSTLQLEQQQQQQQQQHQQQDTAVKKVPLSCLHETTHTLGPTALSLIREILAEVLLHDLSQSKQLRELLGKDESIVPTWIQDLAFDYDKVQESFRGRPSKDVVLTQEEQRTFVSLVCLLGNLCHLCRTCQDRLRETLVPVNGVTEGDASSRTGLHLLLSCTSLSHTCFTLREWSVVAIRNALDDNHKNQALVAELQAQQPAPSAPLDEMGVRMQLEKNGNVSLKPIQENE